jgi:hypothetical protein
MKKSPQNQKLEQMLRSSKIVAGGFMGADTRAVDEIIETDAASLAVTGKTADEVAQRMMQITDVAKAAFGAWVKIDSQLQAMVDEAKGFLVCPWPHPARIYKRLTLVKNMTTGKEMRWSDLNIHLIMQHGFFEGIGSVYRLEPREVVDFIF